MGDGDCRYKLNGGTCAGSDPNLRRLCPCKTGLTKYEQTPEVVNPYDESVTEKKCGPGFVAIRDRNACKLAAEQLGADFKFTGWYLVNSGGLCWIWKYDDEPHEVRFLGGSETGMPVCVRPFSDFAPVEEEEYKTPTVELYRVVVKDLSLNAHELPAVKANDNIIRGPFGGLLDHKWATQDGNFGMWQYNTLAAAKFGLCRVTTNDNSQWWHHKTCTADLWEPLENFLLGQETLEAAMGGIDQVGCGGDGMAHVNKGVVGIRIEDVPYAKLGRVYARHFESFGSRPASSPCNDLTDEHMRGSDVYGLVMGGVDKLDAERVIVKHLESTDGAASGIAFSGRMPNWDLAHTLGVRHVNGVVEPSLVTDASDLSCPFSGEKPSQWKWRHMNDGPSQCDSVLVDMCEVGGTITGDSCQA